MMTRQEIEDKGFRTVYKNEDNFPNLKIYQGNSFNGFRYYLSLYCYPSTCIFDTSIYLYYQGGIERVFSGNLVNKTELTNVLNYLGAVDKDNPKLTECGARFNKNIEHHIIHFDEAHVVDKHTYGEYYHESKVRTEIKWLSDVKGVKFKVLELYGEVRDKYIGKYFRIKRYK